MSKNRFFGLRHVAWSLLVASIGLAAVSSTATAQSADEKAAAPAIEQVEKAADASPAAEKAPEKPAENAKPADPKPAEVKPAEEKAKETTPKEETKAPAAEEAKPTAEAKSAEEAEAATVEEGPQPPFVSKGQVNVISGDSAILSFKAVPYEGKDLQVAVFYGEKDGGKVQEDWQFNSGQITYDKTLSREDFTYNIKDNLKPLTSYFYRICAKTSDGVTWSEPGEFETLQAAMPWYMVFGILVGILLLFIVPFMIGGFVARGLRMPDYGWKIGLIIWSLACGIVIVGFGWPPHLGIDLSGGVILVYELEEDEEVLGDQKDAAKKAADEKDAQAEDEADAKFGDDKSERKVDMQKLMGAMALRINPGGTREITLRQYGPKQIEIIIPRASDEQVKRIEDKVSRAGTLAFRILANEKDHSEIIALGNKTEGKKVKDGSGNVIAEWVPITKGREDEFALFKGIATRTQNYAGEESLEILVVIDRYNVTGEYLDGCWSGFDDRIRPCVDFSFNSQGGRRFGALTNDNLPDEVGDFKRHLGIILDGYLYSAPYINGPITTRGQITGDFTKKEVQDLVDVLNAGSLPAALKKNPISRLSTGPTLGHDTIIRGAWSCAISLVVVILFMITYYRFSGLVACFALLVNLLLVLAIMIAVKADFTLPGIAGLALTMGMAVDANVLIYERIREELAKDAALRMAIRNGFGNALSAIVDSNVTTLITAVVLFVVGTEQIKGFSVTLFLGVALSMYTAIFCSRVIFDIGERQRWIKKLSMMQFFTQPNLDFIGMRYLGGALSLTLIIVGLVCVAARGKGILDIDFTGGVSVQVLFKDSYPIAKVRDSLQELPDLAVSDVQLLAGEEASRRFVVNTSEQAASDEAKKSGESSIAIVERYISDVFGDKLATNKMDIGEITPQSIALNFQYPLNAESIEDYITAEFEKAGESNTSFGLNRKQGFRPSDTEPYHDWVVETTLAPDKAKEIFGKLKGKIDSDPYFPASSNIGGSVAKDMQLKGIYAILASMVFILAYIWIRFQHVVFGLAAIVALVHDILITLGAVAASAYLSKYLGFIMIEDFKIGLTVLAAFLTIIGYSLNDTIVVFDRIREVRGKSPDITGPMINLSINQTLSRTVLTGLTTMAVVIILYIGGGQTIHAFAFSLFVGMIVGTYSSVFIASPILYWMGRSASKSRQPANSK